MEYLEGETLADRRLRAGALPLDAGADGRHRDRRRARHGASRRHRASRSEAGQRHARPRRGAKLLDFGLAKARRRCRSTASIDAPTTPHDDRRRRARSSARSSTWRPSRSKGATPTRAPTSSRSAACSTRCSTGQKAFEGKTRRASSARSCRTGTRRRLRAAAGRVPPALDRVVRTCLAKDPDERWQTGARSAPRAEMDREPRDSHRA